jgi:putative endonuclease
VWQRRAWRHSRLQASTTSTIVIPSGARDLLLRIEKHYHVYILASRSRTLYTGVTNDLTRRTLEHRLGPVPGFASRYRIHRLVYFEEFRDVRGAIAREKQIKGWDRANRVALIESVNPTWGGISAPNGCPRIREKRIPRYARDDSR